MGEIIIRIKRDSIDDTYALHGKTAIDSLIEIGKSELSFLIFQHIDNKLKENENYYIERAEKITEELLRKKKEREK